MYVYVCRVVLFEVCQCGVNVFVAGRFRHGGLQSLLHKVSYSVTHHLAVFFKTMQRQSALFQRKVHGLCQVFQCIYECSVKIKYYKFLHALLFSFHPSKIHTRIFISNAACASIILQFAACDRLWEKSDITLCQIYHYFCTLKV